VGVAERPYPVTWICPGLSGLPALLADVCRLLLNLIDCIPYLPGRVVKVEAERTELLFNLGCDDVLAVRMVHDELADLLYQAVPAVTALEAPGHASIFRVSPKVPEYPGVLLLQF
jgi:hypothetical protein